MSLFMLSMVGRVLVIVGVLVPMLFFDNLPQSSPTQIAFWVITVVGLALWLYGRIGDKVARDKARLKASRANKVEVELDEDEK